MPSQMLNSLGDNASSTLARIPFLGEVLGMLSKNSVSGGPVYDPASGSWTASPFKEDPNWAYKALHLGGGSSADALNAQMRLALMEGDVEKQNAIARIQASAKAEVDKARMLEDAEARNMAIGQRFAENQRPVGLSSALAGTTVGDAISPLLTKPSSSIVPFDANLAQGFATKYAPQFAKAEDAENAILQSRGGRELQSAIGNKIAQNFMLTKALEGDTMESKRRLLPTAERETVAQSERNIAENRAEVPYAATTAFAKAKMLLRKATGKEYIPISNGTFLEVDPDTGATKLYDKQEFTEMVDIIDPKSKKKTGEYPKTTSRIGEARQLTKSVSPSALGAMRLFDKLNELYESAGKAVRGHGLRHLP